MAQANITIRNLNRSYKLNEAFIKKIAIKILALLKKSRYTKLEFIFLDDRSIRTLNRKYKNRDRPTDVLSFRIDLREFKSRGFLGEIFISLDTAFRNARRFNTSFERELALYMIHAILHLFGYDDKKIKDRLKMSKKEKGILNRLCEREDLARLLIIR